jgi:hypothetical protein
MMTVMHLATHIKEIMNKHKYITLFVPVSIINIVSLSIVFSLKLRYIENINIINKDKNNPKEVTALLNDMTIGLFLNRKVYSSFCALVNALYVSQFIEQL